MKPETQQHVPVRILIAEDSPTQAQRLRHILEGQGYEVSVAGNGRTALEMARQFCPAMIISDVVMPEMDGYELSRRIKADAALRDIPVILVTTMSDPRDVIRGLECGADNFVLKPYDADYLLARVRYVLVNRDVRRPDDMGVGVEICFAGNRHFITADRLQILNLLLSTYDAAIQRNRELNRSQEELQSLNRKLRRSQEDLRLLNARVEAANRAKSTFLATMSHEIRTPMNGVLGMIELLSLTRLDAEQSSTVEIVRESGKSLLRIIDDILDFSKIEAGKLEVRPEIASIKEAIEGVHNIFSGNASSRGLRIRSSVDPRISPAVLVDPLRLRQILSNFVSNALKFTAQGSIEIRAELIERLDGEDRVRFSVTDTGIGISPENQQRLFEPFMQAEDDTTRRFGGTGLGLTICRRLAEMMGGSIEMVSELGKGTTMILHLSVPIANPKELAEIDAEGTPDSLRAAMRMRRAAPGAAQAEAEGTLVLSVDDHATNRMILERQLNALGYAAVSAKDGREAMSLWESGQFGLVITDCNMPEMDGYELVRGIRALESASGEKRVPIIACTANALGGEADHCLAAGMDDYLVKPFELKDLLKKLDQWLPIPEAAAAWSGQSDQPPESTTAGTGAAAPLDRSVLAAISGGDAGAERDILLDFKRVNDEDAAMLERAVSKSDLPQVTRATHRIKGASRMVGAIGLASVCERIEHASRVHDWTTVAISMNAFHHEWTRLNGYFDSLWSNHPGSRTGKAGTNNVEAAS
ncbi:MAG TPA: response regulator [Thermoanaerobaculia bacterium]|nr:response regulator [Thermoanaerobaculia bacterium]